MGVGVGVLPPSTFTTEYVTGYGNALAFSIKQVVAMKEVFEEKRILCDGVKMAMEARQVSRYRCLCLFSLLQCRDSSSNGL